MAEERHLSLVIRAGETEQKREKMGDNIQLPEDGETFFVSQLDRAIYKIKFELHEKLLVSGLTGQNITGLTAHVMRELNKVRLGKWYSRVSLDGETKRRIAVSLIEFAVLMFAGPHVQEVFPTEAIIDVIQFVYSSGIHRLKSKR